VPSFSGYILHAPCFTGHTQMPGPAVHVDAMCSDVNTHAPTHAFHPDCMPSCYTRLRSCCPLYCTAQVNAYLQSQGKAVRSAAVIQSNPDQSKHLETARMKINDIWIDLVNLRWVRDDGSHVPSKMLVLSHPAGLQAAQGRMPVHPPCYCSIRDAVLQP
jgi:hypothetical protein